MDDKSKESTPDKDDSRKQKGFYAALFSCVGIMLALAAVIGYSNFIAPDNGTSVASNDGGTSVASGGGGYSESILPGGITADSGDEGVYLDEDWSAAVNSSLDEPVDQGDADARRSATKAPSATADASTASAAPEATENAAEDNEARATEKQQESPGAESDADPEVDGSTDAASGSAERSSSSSETISSSLFTDGDAMDWPLVGEVVMEYSVDHVIYDKTLDQYRTNSNICISGAVGSEVQAAADGVVSQIVTTRESGVTVVIDHGNGWATTYSQLEDEDFVRVGDVVDRGETIGHVGEPSIYSVMLGNHLGFAVTRDDASVDPETILAVE